MSLDIPSYTAVPLIPAAPIDTTPTPWVAADKTSAAIADQSMLPEWKEMNIFEKAATSTFGSVLGLLGGCPDTDTPRGETPQEAYGRGRRDEASERRSMDGPREP